MELDRRSIERDDFATARRGYDPEEVRLHLREIADRVEELERERQAAPVADSAASQVRAIVKAAERTGTELESAARKEADRIRAEAEGIRAEADTEAARARERATAEAAGHLDRVHEASARVLERAEAIERALAELRDEAAALGAEVGADEPASTASFADPDTDDLARRDAARPAERVKKSAAKAARDAAPETEDSEAEDTRAGSAEDLEADVPGASEPTAGDEPVEAEVLEGGEDVEDARLVALNMALNGSPREETAGYLEEHFAIADPDALLDEVYARVGA